MQRVRSTIKDRLKEIELPRYTEIDDWIDGQNVADHLSFEAFFSGLHDRLPETKICIIIDEFDGIPKEALRNFLYTLREIYTNKRRSEDYNYIHSVGIVGVKSIAQLDFDHSISPFNIQDGFALPNFTREQVADLYGQYTEETGQAFAPEVIEAVHHKTTGQPFLVNRLGRILTVELGVDKTETITLEHFHKVYRRLPNDNNTHFQHLRRNINRKPEFKRVLNRVMFDDREMEFNINDARISELNTYGIVRENEEGICVIDSPIYQEIIIKTFTPVINGIEDDYLPESGDDFTDYLSEAGEVQMDALLDNFRDFIGRTGYRILEVPKTPQEFVGQYLLLTYLALFARQIKGHLYPEVPTGHGRMDVLLLYREEKYIVETKLWRGKKRYQRGKHQLAAYLKTEGVQRGYYVVFDRRRNPEAQYERETVDGREIVSYCIPIPTEKGNDAT